MQPQKIKNLINRLPPEEKADLLKKLELLNEKKTQEKAEQNFLDFVEAMWPAFIKGKHHEIMADAFERMVFVVALCFAIYCLENSG